MSRLNHRSTGSLVAFLVGIPEGGLAAICLLCMSAAYLPNPAHAAADDRWSPPEELKRVDPAFSAKLREAKASAGFASSSLARVRIATPPPDTIYIGHTPGHQGPGNYWSIYSGRGPGFHNLPTGGATWGFDTPVNGDSLQGWWPIRGQYTSTGGLIIADYARPWWAIDIGNNANYVINQGAGHKRTFGVVGVWHRDNGSVSGGGVTWAPLAGNYSAWMGLRRHGDASFVDPVTGNAFNEDVLMFNPASNRKGFPGYGSQMDQMLYRDIVVDPAESLTLSFTYRTNMSTGFGTLSNTRTGWFDKDPLAATSNGTGSANTQPGNFISSTDAGANAPCDSFMVYIGAPVGSSFLASTGDSRPVYDPLRRWFAEVLRANEGFYRELESVAGTIAPITRTVTLPSATVQTLAAGGNLLRLVFRVKTNRGFDDEGTAYSSGGAGAAVVDDITYRIGSGALVTLGDFESPGAIDNADGDPLASWKSTGKPPAIYHHVHDLSSLVYEDLCGQPGSPSRLCNMSGAVVSAGDHDQNEAAGGLAGFTAERERNDVIVSPTICLAGPYPNAMGIQSLDDATPTDDYYVRYELYAGIFDLFEDGNLWRIGFQSYPDSAKASSGGYPAWGAIRYATSLYFNPDRECFVLLDAIKRGDMLRTSNSSGVPDSVRIVLTKMQQCFRFGITTTCSPTYGAYWDNVSLAIVDAAPPAPLTAEIFDWINDTFPANETPGLPGQAARFDTCAALIKTGRNIAAMTGDNLRHAVPGDSMVVRGAGSNVRVDLVFRILPGPGNYSPIGSGVSGVLKRSLDSPAAAVPGDGSFWGQYMVDPGMFAIPNAAALHAAHPSKWDPNVWNSARCDTAETNLFPVQRRGISGGPHDNGAWMATYHEDDPRFGELGIERHKCFLVDTLSSVDMWNITCASLPAWVIDGGSPYRTGYDDNVDTMEGTKILPDGLLTPGAHVEYFFRKAENGIVTGLLPDTGLVYPQAEEGSLDGHRWQQFGVLPDRWKDPAYEHPVFRTFGLGAACMLVVDNADRRGDELAWVSVADTIGATRPFKYGAHNGWHARGDQDVNDPAGFVAVHGGQPGTTWDFYQVKSSEDFPAGSLGSRLAYRGGPMEMAARSSRQGPTPEMIGTFYKAVLFLSGDRDRRILGPYRDQSQDDVSIIGDWLASANPVVPDRAFWAMGDGFVESNVAEGDGSTQERFVQDYLGVDLSYPGYLQESGNASLTIDLNTTAALTGSALTFGLRNSCLWDTDVLTIDNSCLPTSTYPGYHPPHGYVAGVLKPRMGGSNWVALTDGWAITHLTGWNGTNTVGRSEYFARVFTNLFDPICTIGDTLLTINASSGPNGSISPGGSVMVVPGGSQTFTITPDAGYRVSDVLVDGVSVGAVPSYTFTNVTANHTITASFVALPTVAIGDVSAVEGNAGTTAYSFTVTRTGDPTLPVSAAYGTADGTATLAGNDYTATSGSVVIPADSLSATIVVEAQGDTTYEAHEVFHVRLTGATNATFGDSMGVGTIRNDDQHGLLRDSYVANGTVNATALSPSGDVLYIGGSFTQVGPMTGNCVAIDSTTGQPLDPLPLVAGTVWAAAPDGQGGWYIGGDFTAVMGVPRLRLAHILAGGGLSEWNPGANQRVNALAVSGSTIYVGGVFISIGGQLRNFIAALDAATGAATAWNPDANGVVWALAVSGSTVYAGGAFTSIGGQTRNRIAALDPATGSATAWDPNASLDVRALALSGSIVYAGGAFATIGGQTRLRIAALGAASGTPTAWDPSANSTVYALAVSGSAVYAGGGFSSIGGQARNRIAALDVGTGTATAWNPNANSDVRALALSGSTLYAGGGFTSIGGQARNRIAVLDVTTGAATAWNPNASGTVHALALSGSTVCAGGEFTSLGALARSRIAALDVATGAATAWNPNAISSVYALAVSGSTVYAGGAFTIIGGQVRNRIAALDAATGNATAWNPNANLDVRALAVSGSTVYAGGDFTTIGGRTRQRIAALDGATGTATAWDPSANNTVRSLAPALGGSLVYAGGDFTTIGGQTRNRIAALVASSGSVAPWDINANNVVYTIAVNGFTVYAGGDFTSIGGQTRNRIVAIHAETGTPTAWDPNANSRVEALTVSGSTIYAGGNFTSIGGQTRTRIAALDAVTGAAVDWDPAASGTTINHDVLALAIGSGTVYAGGGFPGIAGLPQSCLAAIRAVPSATTGVEETREVPDHVVLSQSYPNPARGGFTIRFGLPRPGPVSLRVYDVSGRIVRVLLDGGRPAGWHSVRWNRTDTRGGRLVAGIYFYELRTPGVRLTRKLVALE